MGLKELKELASNGILRMDLLCAKPSFRTRQQPVYETVLGGIMSIAVLAVFYYFLYTQLVIMLNKLSISYNQGVDDNVHSTSSITSFPFAVSIEGVDLSLTPRKFIIELLQHRINSTSPSPSVVTANAVTLAPCNYSDWSGYGSHIQHQYQGLGFNHMLCIQTGQNVSLSGYSGSDIFDYLSLNVHECNQTKDGNCDTVPNINSYMASHIAARNYFKVKIFVLDTVVAPDSHNALTYMLEQNIFLAFTTQTGSVGHVNMAEFKLVTDNSLTPISSWGTTHGQRI